MITLASKRYTIAAYAGTLDSRYPEGDGHAGALFWDDFAAGDLTKTENSVSWGGVASVSVVSDAGNSSGYAARFRYNPSAPTPSSQSQLSFSLGALYEQLWFKIRLVIPSHYSHTDGPSADNNKFFRLWGGNVSDGDSGYTDFYVKFGSSLFPEAGDTGDSYLLNELGTDSAAVGPTGGTAADNFINSADFGEEITIVMHFKVDTAGTAGAFYNYNDGNGVSELWKDGTRIFGYDTIQCRPSAGTNAFAFGYLMGWANSPYLQGAQTVDFLLREFVVAESNIFGVT